MAIEETPLNKQDRILALIKFGERSHMKELLHDGHLYMSPLSTFIQMEKDCLRGDKDEAIDYTIAASGAQLSIKENDKWIPVGGLTGAIRWRKKERITANVFCMYSFLESQLLNQPLNFIDSRNFKFGDTFVVLIDADEFLRRVNSEIIRRNLNFRHAPIEYVSMNSFNGGMGIFRKFTNFNYQSEYRFAILPGVEKPYSLCIGSITDIARIGSVSNIANAFRFNPPGLRR